LPESGAPTRTVEMGFSHVYEYAGKSAPSNSAKRSLSWSIKAARIRRHPARTSDRISKNRGSLKISRTTLFHSLSVCVIRDTLFRMSSAWRSVVDSALSSNSQQYV
jgi:hypothetical protein